MGLWGYAALRLYGFAGLRIADCGLKIADSPAHPSRAWGYAAVRLWGYGAMGLWGYAAIRLCGVAG